MVRALDYAGEEATRQSIREEVERIRSLTDDSARRRERAILRDMRKRWSERFATACASMIADEVRAHPRIPNRYSVLPDDSGSGQETFTPLGYNKGKRIDVVVAGPLVGLQLGVSLKGLNFADDESRNYDKNLTGRLYELRDEVSTVHDHLPRAFMAALFFMPIGGCGPKKSAPSSFAHLATELGTRTGRLDPTIGAQAWKCDYAAIGLYAPGDPAAIEDGVESGVVRYFPLMTQDGQVNRPPRAGLPPVGATLSCAQLVDRIVRAALEGTAAAVEYGPAETVMPAPEGLASNQEAIDDYEPEEDEGLDEQ